MNDFNLENIEGFDWDEANSRKNEIKHQVTKKECEEVFFNKPLIIFPDTKHSLQEARYAAFGITDRQRLVTLVYTIRNKKIRIISARDQSKKDRKIFDTYL